MILLQVEYYDFIISIAVVDFPTESYTMIAFLLLRTKLERIRNFVLTSFQYLWLYWMSCPSFYINSFCFLETFTMNFQVNRQQCLSNSPIVLLNQLLSHHCRAPRLFKQPHCLPPCLILFLFRIALSQDCMIQSRKARGVWLWRILMQRMVSQRFEMYDL
jgi:hypothetical protein